MLKEYRDMHHYSMGENSIFATFEKVLFYNSKYEWMDLELVKSLFNLLDPLWTIMGFTQEPNETLDAK